MWRTGPERQARVQCVSQLILGKDSMVTIIQQWHEIQDQAVKTFDQSMIQFCLRNIVLECHINPPPHTHTTHRHTLCISIMHAMVPPDSGSVGHSHLSAVTVIAISIELQFSRVPLHTATPWNPLHQQGSAACWPVVLKAGEIITVVGKSKWTPGCKNCINCRWFNSNTTLF